MTRRRSVLAAAAVAGGAALAGGGVAWWRQRHATPDANAGGLWEMGFPAPNGRPLAMAPLRGKPLVLNFWATWCAPCIKELPQFERFHQEFGTRGWQVVGLAIDNADAVQAFLKRAAVTYPVGLAGMDGADLMIALGNPHGVLPFTVVFDAAGQPVQKRLGETSYEDLKNWASAR